MCASLEVLPNFHSMGNIANIPAAADTFFVLFFIPVLYFIFFFPLAEEFDRESGTSVQVRLARQAARATWRQKTDGCSAGVGQKHCERRGSIIFVAGCIATMSHEEGRSVGRMNL